MKTEDLLLEIESLPVEERARVADSVLKSLNPPESEIDKKWGLMAKERLAEIQSGKIQPISGDDVFEEVWKRFS